MSRLDTTLGARVRFLLEDYLVAKIRWRGVTRRHGRQEMACAGTAEAHRKERDRRAGWLADCVLAEGPATREQVQRAARMARLRTHEERRRGRCLCSMAVRR